MAVRMRKLFGQAVSWYWSVSIVFSRIHYLAGVYKAGIRSNELFLRY